MEFRIVDVSAEHIRQIEEIERDCFSRPWTAEQLKSQMRDEQHEFIAAVDGSRVFGYVGLMYGLDEGYISNVAVHPDARRQGIGDTLIDALAAKAAELAALVYGKCAELGGSLRGEYGIGCAKKQHLGAEALDKFSALKAKYDPKGILNPGKAAD